MPVLARSLALLGLVVLAPPVYGWRVEVAGTPPESRPFAVRADSAGAAIVAGRADVAPNDTDGLVVKLAGATGAETWRRSVVGDGGGDDRLEDAGLFAGDDVLVVGRVVNAGTLNDAYVARLAAADGGVVWTRTIDGGASAGDNAFAGVVSPGGDAVVTGNSTAMGGTSALTVWRLAGADGATLWGVQLAGTSGVGRGVVVLPGGDVVVAGEVTNTGQGTDVVVARLAAADGAVQWRVEIAGDGAANDDARALALRLPDHAILGARHVDATTGPDAVVASLALANGAEAWRTTADGTATGADDADDLQDVGVDGGGDVVAAGELHNLGTNGDMLVLALDGATGGQRWRREINGAASNDDARALALRPDGDVVVAGSMRFIVVPADAAVLRLAGATGAEVWRRIIPGSANRADVAFEVAVDAAGHALVGARTRNGDTADAWTVVKLSGGSGGDFPCGDGVEDPGEACDDANTILGDGCRADCTAEVCGDSHLDPGEGCDDGNGVDGDCCSTACVAGADGTPCDDGSSCTQTDVCVAGACAGQNPIVCVPADSCQTAACDPVDGTCVAALRLDGTVCDDGNACTQGDRCQAGTCTSGAGCEADGDPCTEDVCDPAAGCLRLPLAGFPAVSCVLQRDLIATNCPTELPRGVTRALASAARRVDRAAELGSGRRARRLLAQARGAGRQAQRLAERQAKRERLAAACAEAVAFTMTFFVREIDELRTALGSSGAR